MLLEVALKVLSGFSSWYPCCVLLVVFLLLSPDVHVRANPDAKRLYDDLLRRSGYNKLIRPVGNNSDKLTVKLGLRLSQLIDVVSPLLSCPTMIDANITVLLTIRENSENLRNVKFYKACLFLTCEQAGHQYLFRRVHSTVMSIYLGVLWSFCL